MRLALCVVRGYQTQYARRSTHNEYMPQTILGIDIGSYSVKIAKLQRSFKSFEFVNFYERKIQYNELLSPEESISVTLQGMIDDFDLKWDQVICGYPGQKTSSRLISLPFGSLSKIEETLEFELEGHIPFELEVIQLDYHVLRSSKEVSDILTFYTLKQEFGAWIKMLESSRLDPKIVTVEGTEFLNLVCLGMVPPEGPYAILDLGHAKSNLAVCVGRQLNLIRSISFGGKNITEKIQKKLNVPPEEAERLKIEMGGIPLDEKEKMDELSLHVGEAMEEALEEFLISVRQVLFAFRDKEGKPVEGIYLCGGSSRIPRIDRYLSLRLKQNVAFIDPASFHFTQLEKVTAHRAVMPQALALGLRSVAAARMPRLNLRQGEFAFKGDVEKIHGTLRHVAIAVGLILVLGLSYFGIKYYFLSKRVKNLNARITEMVKQVLPESPKSPLTPASALRLLKTEANKMQDRTKKLSEVQGLLVLDVIKEISVRVPSRTEIKLDIEDLNIKGNRMSFSGTFDSFVTDKVKAALEDSPLIKDVKPGNVRKGLKEDEVKFEMTMDLVPPGEDHGS